MKSICCRVGSVMIIRCDEWIWRGDDGVKTCSFKNSLVKANLCLYNDKLASWSTFRGPIQEWKKNKKKTHFLMTEHIFFNLYPKPTLQPLVLSPAKRPDLLHLQFHNLGTNWSPQKCLNMAKKLCISWKCFPDVATRENAGLVVSLWIKGDAIFLWPAILLLIWGHLIWSFSLEGDRNTVTHGALLSLAAEFKVTGTHGPQGGWVLHPLLTRGTKALCSGTGRHAKTLIKRHELASPPSSHLEK